MDVFQLIERGGLEEEENVQGCGGDRTGEGLGRGKALGEEDAATALEGWPDGSCKGRHGGERDCGGGERWPK